MLTSQAGSVVLLPVLALTLAFAAPAGIQPAAVKLAVRWGPVMQSTTAEDNTEASDRYVEAVWPMRLSETALLLVDVWDWHSVRSHRQRAAEITRSTILPLVEAAREAGIVVIHAPSPEIAVRYEQWVRYAGDASREAAVERLLRQRFIDVLHMMDPPEALKPIVDSIPPALKALAPDDPTWPPADFRSRTGDHARYARLRPPAWREAGRLREIPEVLRPKPGDYVIASGDQLHRLLKDRKTLHLLYTGFATNMCVQNSRDYSMEQMGRRGYNCIVLRDCTTGIENAYTLDGLLLTKAAILSLEKLHASATSADLLRALRR